MLTAGAPLVTPSATPAEAPNRGISSGLQKQMTIGYRLSVPKAVKEMLRVAKKKVILIEPIPEYFGPLQRLYAFATDYIRGLPQFLEREGIDVESVELLSSAANPLNLGAMVTLRPSAKS